MTKNPTTVNQNQNPMSILTMRLPGKFQIQSSSKSLICGKQTLSKAVNQLQSRRQYTTIFFMRSNCFAGSRFIRFLTDSENSIRLLCQPRNFRTPGAYKYGTTAIGGTIGNCDQEMVLLLRDIYPDLISSGPCTRLGTLRGPRSWKCNASFLTYI